MSGNPKDLADQVNQLQLAIEQLKTQAGLQAQAPAPQAPPQSAPSSGKSSMRSDKSKKGDKSKEEMRLESMAKLINELQKDNMHLRGQLKKDAPPQQAARKSVTQSKGRGAPAPHPNSRRKPNVASPMVKIMGPSGRSLHAAATVEVVKEAGGTQADLSFLKYHQDILDTFRPALRALISGLINYKFEHHDHIILPYYRTYIYGGEAYVLYHEADKVQRGGSPLERVPFRRPLDMDVFVPIDVKDWSEPHRLQRKQELFIQDLWKIWGSPDIQNLAEMAIRSLNNRGFDLTGPYMSTAVSALFLKDPQQQKMGGFNIRGPHGHMGQQNMSIDNDRMYRKVCLEYYDATADHMVTLVEFQLKPRVSWGDFDEVYTMTLNGQDFCVNKLDRGPVIIKNKKAVLPHTVRVPSVKKVIRVACTGVSGNRAVQIREVDGQVQLHAPQDRCRNPNPSGVPTIPIKAVTDLSRRDWFLDTVVTPLMRTDPEVLQDVRALSRQMQKEQNIFPRMSGDIEKPLPQKPPQFKR